MSFIAGDIMIRMAADVASLRRDMDDARRTVSGAVDNMKSALGTLGAAISVAGLMAWAKSAIDVADKAEEMGQKVGLSVEELSRLSYAFKTNGVESEALQGSLVKMSKNIIDNEGAFKALGISVKNADGSYRAANDVLGDVADFFKILPDGVTKTALATELFGKAGADLIPVLNGGKEGLKAASDEAERFGAVISSEAAKAAGEFNDALDLMKMTAQALTVNGLAPILPILTEIARQFTLVGSATKDSAQEIGPWQSIFMTAAEAVGVVLLNVVYVARAIGGEITTIGKQIAALAQGEFKEAGRIGDEWTAKAALMRQEVDSQSAAILNARNKMQDLGGSTSETASEIERLKDRSAANAQAQAEAALKAKELAAEQAKAAEAAAKHAAELDKVAQTLKLEQAGLSGDYLTKLQQLNELRVTGRLTTEEYDKAVQALIARQPVIKAGAEAQQKAQDELNKTYAAAAAASTKYELAQIAETEALRESVVKLREQNETAGMNERQLVAREAAVLRNRAADLEWQAGMEGGNYQLEEQARLLKERANLLEQGVAAKEAKAAADEWKKTTDNIQNGLTDALMRGFESGKGFAENLKDYIKNAFKTLIADFIIRPVMAPISQSVGEVLKTITGGGGGGGFSSLLSSGMDFLTGGTMSGMGLSLVNSSLGQALGLSSAQTIGGNVIVGPTALGSSIASGIGMLGNGFAGYGISKALSGGYSAGGGVNAIAGIASAFFGPIAGVVGGLINRAFGRKAVEMRDAGITGSITGGDVTGQKFQDWFQKGGWFRSDRSGTNFSSLEEDLAASLDFGAKSVLDQTKAYADALNLPVEALSQVSTNFRVVFTQNAEANQEAINLVFKNYEIALTRTFESVISPFQKAGESVADTMARLVVLQQFSEDMNDLGGVFSRIAGSSIEARENIIGLAGGIDKLLAAAGAFVRDYYTQAEQAGLQAKSALQAFADLGLSGSGISSRDDFRRLVESVDVSTQQGQEQLIALLNLAPQFAQLADYLQQQSVTLEEAAQQAPAVALLDQILPQATNTTEAVNLVVEQVKAGNMTLEQIVSAVRDGNVTIANGLAAIVRVQEYQAQLIQTQNAIAADTNQAITSNATNVTLESSAPTYNYDIGQTYESTGA